MVIVSAAVALCGGGMALYLSLLSQSAQYSIKLVISVFLLIDCGVLRREGNTHFFW